MIHHSCDLCKRLIDTEQDVRYVVKIEVYAALDPATGSRPTTIAMACRKCKTCWREWKSRKATS